MATDGWSDHGSTKQLLSLMGFNTLTQQPVQNFVQVSFPLQELVALLFW